ncbi:dihydrofolate reductase [Eubacteriales bacterium OttesenSCG-928-K08]|nr:dihydrofolate reductase [Eubacteriales bacterium OttesenSCG-928-K08]
MELELIVAVDRHWGIGQKNSLQFHIREDMQRFKKMTIGQVVVLGRNTLDTFPKKAPLQGRQNIILTKNPAFAAQDAIILHSIKELGALLRLPAYSEKKVFVIGGAQVYSQLLPYCTLAHVTHVCARRPADAKFPRLTRLENWSRAACPDWQQTEDGLRYMYVTYQNQNPLAMP